MQAILSQIPACWADVTLLVNYEATTLPLLFAADADFSLYYNTMKRLHPRRARQLHEVQKIGLTARKRRAEGDYAGCVSLLCEACEKRHFIFEGSDFQILAAHEHLVQSCVHLAVIAMADGHLPDAHSLLHRAAALLKEYRAGEGTHAVGFTRFERARMGLVLHCVFASYWARRGRWNAAHQAAVAAVSKWGALVASAAAPNGRAALDCSSSSSSATAVLLESRVLAAAAMVTEETQALKHLVESAEELRGRAEAVASTGTNELSFTLTAVGTEACGSPLSQSFTATVCTVSSERRFHAPWPIARTAAFLALYSAAVANLKLRRIAKCQLALELCALDAGGPTEVEGATLERHEHWMTSVTTLSRLSVDAAQCDMSGTFATPAAAMRAPDVLTAAKLLRDHVAEQRKAVASERKQRAHRVWLRANGEDEEAEAQADRADTANKERREATEGGDAPLQWAAVAATFEARRPPASSCERARVGASPLLVAPLEFARSALQSRNTRRVATPAADVRSTHPHRDCGALPHLGGSGHTRSPMKRAATTTPTCGVTTSSVSVTPQPKAAQQDVVNRYAAVASRSDGRPRIRHAEDAQQATSPHSDAGAPALREELLNAAATEFFHDGGDPVPAEKSGPATEVQQAIEEVEAAIAAEERLVRFVRRRAEQRRRQLAVLRRVAEAETRAMAALDTKTAAADGTATPHGSEEDDADSDEVPEGAASDVGDGRRDGGAQPQPGAARAVDRLRRAVGLIGAVAVEEKRHARHRRRSSRRGGSMVALRVMSDGERAQRHPHLGQFFRAAYSGVGESLPPSADPASGIVHATKESDLVPGVAPLAEKQRVLRSMLPALDHRTEAYRMVTKELAENERVLALRRVEHERALLERNADRIAKKAGILNAWQKLVSRKDTLRATATSGAAERSPEGEACADVDGGGSTQVMSEAESGAAGLVLCLLLHFAFAPPSATVT